MIPYIEQATDGIALNTAYETVSARVYTGASDIDPTKVARVQFYRSLLVNSTEEEEIWVSATDCANLFDMNVEPMKSEYDLNEFG